MTYIASTDEIDADLEAKFDRVVSPEFRAKLESMARKAAEEYGYELQAQLSFMLEDGQLAEAIRSAAQRMAGYFIDRVQAGDDSAVEQFLGNPNSQYYNERKNIRVEWQYEHGGIALRRRLVEAVQDRLESEVIKDQAAEIAAIREAYHKAITELAEWRAGERA